jgi:hypothetical protein
LDDYAEGSNLTNVDVTDGAAKLARELTWDDADLSCAFAATIDINPKILQTQSVRAQPNAFFFSPEKLGV